MKIIRYRDRGGDIHFGEMVSADSALRLEGDLAKGLRCTGEKADMAKLLAPVVPAAIFCIGMNYRRHAEETGGKVPQWPVLFMKNPASVQNPGDPIEIPAALPSEQVDYECELAVVVGRTCKNVPPEKALDYVLGYTCANDVSARDWQLQRSGSQWCRAKSFDTFCPLGPCMVTPDEITNPNSLGIRTILNGERVQDWNTSDMIFDVPRIVAFLSGSTTLLAGTVILTGTPHGVGMARTPQIWLNPGDTVTVEIDGIGALTNPVRIERLA
jgi:2-keto-4-pentenoate hydratase/2-oxohepta-3-ene-1,7-dioic acid hydratase in catechol pathway